MRVRGAADSICLRLRLSPAPRALIFLLRNSWGSAPLHPTLEAVDCSAGSVELTTSIGHWSPTTDNACVLEDRFVGVDRNCGRFVVEFDFFDHLFASWF
jgi:hypothetical protein